MILRLVYSGSNYIRVLVTLIAHVDMPIDDTIPRCLHHHGWTSVYSLCFGTCRDPPQALLPKLEGGQLLLKPTLTFSCIHLRCPEHQHKQNSAAERPGKSYKYGIQLVLLVAISTARGKQRNKGNGVCRAVCSKTQRGRKGRNSSFHGLKQHSSNISHGPR